MVTIIPRSDWGARPPTGAYSPWNGSHHGLVVHYVGGAGSIGLADHARCPERVRGIQSYEQSKGYVDIAYNLVLCPHGSIYEGRGLAKAGAANGPSTNSTMPSVCYLANVDDHLTEPAKVALRLLRAEFPPEFLGHREVNATSCPGNSIFAWVVSERALPAAAALPPVSATSPPPTGLYAALRELGHTFAAGATLRRGHTGYQVQCLQLALIAGFGQRILADGDFGPATESAVKNAQRYFGLAVDGIVGPQTRGLIAAVLRLKFP